MRPPSKEEGRGGRKDGRRKKNKLTSRETLPGPQSSKLKRESIILVVCTLDGSPPRSWNDGIYTLDCKSAGIPAA